MLTKTDLTALRKCDTIVASHRDGKSHLRATKTKPSNSTDPFATDIDHIIDVGSRIMDNAKAFAMIGSAKYCPVWTTIAKSLKVGDELTLEWRANDHQNEYLKNVGINADVCYLVAVRGNKRLCWIFDVSICPDNTARMIQQVEYAIAV